jgi:hypothetical protein
LLRGEGAVASKVNEREYLPGQALHAGDSLITAGGASFALIEVLP